MKKILQKDIDKLKSTQTALDKATAVLNDRMAYILKTVCEVFRLRYDKDWRIASDFIDSYDDYENNSGKLPLKEVLSKNKDITYYSDFYSINQNENYDYDGDRMIIDSKKKEYSLYENIPKRWLFEDFEEELMIGARKYIIKCKKAKEVRDSKLLKKNAWLTDIKEKLTASEWTKLEKYFKGY